MKKKMLVPLLTLSRTSFLRRMKQDCLQPRQLTNSFEPGENVLLRLPGTKIQPAAADLKSSCVTAPVAAPVAVVRPVRGAPTLPTSGL